MCVCTVQGIYHYIVCCCCYLVKHGVLITVAEIRHYRNDCHWTRILLLVYIYITIISIPMSGQVQVEGSRYMSLCVGGGGALHRWGEVGCGCAS